MSTSCNNQMRRLRPRDAKTCVVVGRAEAVARLQPLIAAHRKGRPVRLIGPACTPSDLNDAGAVLVVGDARISPRKALPGVFLQAANGRRVPAGWLPDVGDRLSTYARTAGEVQLRCQDDAARGPFVFLSELDDRALEVVDRVAAEMPPSEPVFRWTSERIRRDDLMAALQGGQGAALYFGHGVARGWAGYGGFDKSSASGSRGKPLGSILCLTCSVASRPRYGLSFCEEMVLSGLCSASLGATGRTLHESNVQLGLALAHALRSSSVMTISDLILSPDIRVDLLKRYRIIGDPLAPLIGAAGSVEKAQAVFAPAPDDVLPVIPFSAWV